MRYFEGIEVTPYYEDDKVTLWHGDNRRILAKLDSDSIDSIVTDPPYELGFMGKGWDGSGIAYDEQLWSEAWRVLKPGSHLLAFGGTRTWHRLACAIEDAGFEIRDSIAWMYGSGFPKSLDVSKAIDKAAGAEREVIVSDLRQRNQTSWETKTGMLSAGVKDFSITALATAAAEQWQGWGTALKPAHEPIVVARKPLIGTVAANVLAYGTGALNIDGSRIGAEGGTAGATAGPGQGIYGNGLNGERSQPVAGLGRWPANVILDESQAAELDKQSGHQIDGVTVLANRSREYNASNYMITDNREGNHGYGGSGGASRFFYVAKAPKKERTNVDGIAHPTVKPLTLMRYLCKLVTPPGGTILEPFAGSGTTVEAATQEGFKCVAIELTDEYLPLIMQRINKPTETTLL